MHICVQNRGHLRLLYRAHLALRMHDEHADILFPSQPVDGSATGVSARCSNDGQVFPRIVARFVLIPPHKEVFE